MRKRRSSASRPRCSPRPTGSSIRTPWPGSADPRSLHRGERAEEAGLEEGCLLGVDLPVKPLHQHAVPPVDKGAGNQGAIVVLEEVVVRPADLIAQPLRLGGPPCV